MKSTTIAAISTAQGQGGIGVIRISGGEAVNIADRVFVGKNGKKLAQLKGYRAAFGSIVRGEEIIDEAVALVFRSPKSYTGEEVVELCCHGGTYITKEVLRCVLNAGAEPAQAGEFTKRAFLNGKLDLTEAEAVADLICAKSKAAARAALCAKNGALWKKINKIKDKMVSTAAHLCAWADYPEEDIAEVSQQQLDKTFSECIAEIDRLLKTYDEGQIIKEGIDTVIAGKPNTGKSTLMNLLSGQDKSIVTEIPGTTRDVIEETVAVGGIMLRLNDTAGIHETGDKVEKIGVDIAKSRLTSCALVLAVFDGSKSLDEDDLRIIEDIGDAPAVAVINKIDLGCKIDVDFIKSKFTAVAQICAKNGENCEKLAEIIEKAAGATGFNPSDGILANERQRKATADAGRALREAKESLNSGITLDAVEISLEEAIESLMELTGEKTSEAVVDNIFRNFCVGK